MAQYVTLERAIACPRASVAVAAETAAQVLGHAGYRRGLGFGPTASYVRVYRPTWATALAALGAIPTVGLALLLLLVKTKDHCNVVIEDGPYGVVALVSGRVPADLPAQLEAAVGDRQSQPPVADRGGQGQRSSAVLLTPTEDRLMAPDLQNPQAILRPATPVPGLAPAPSPFPGAGREQSPGPRPGYGPPPPPVPVPGATPAPVAGVGPPPAPVPFPAEAPGDGGDYPSPAPRRPPSRLAPPMPGTPAPVMGQRPVSPPPGGTVSSDDPVSSTSGRVPWPAAGRPASSGQPSPGRQPASPPVSPMQPVAFAPWAHQGGEPPFPVPAAQPTPQPPAPSPGPSMPPPPLPPAPVPVGQASPPQPYATSGSGTSPAGAQPQANGRPQAVGLATAPPLLRVDDGQVLELRAFCLLGREPVAADGDPPAHLIAFDDPKLSVSKTHLAYGLDDRGFWVMDRNSTNGTTVIDPQGQRIPCAPGARQYVTVGSQVQIGQRRITVEGAG